MDSQHADATAQAYASFVVVPALRKADPSGYALSLTRQHVNMLALTLPKGRLIRYAEASTARH